MLLQDAFIAGRPEDVVPHFAMPVVVYSLAGVTVLRDEDEFRRAMNRYREAIISRSVVSGRVEIVERDAPTNGRLRALVRFFDLNAEGQTVTSGLVRYFLVEKGDAYRVEMLEYLESPLPADEVERIVH